MNTIRNLLLCSILLLFSLSGMYAQPSRCNCTIPVIVSQPQTVGGLCILGGQASLSVVAQSTVVMQYQWQLDSLDISDDAVFSGCKSPVITISNPGASIIGRNLRCKITNCLNLPVYSNSAEIVYDFQPTDINTDGTTNNSDFALMLSKYNDNCTNCREDINVDSVVNILDFLKLLAKFNTSCN